MSTEEVLQTGLGGCKSQDSSEYPVGDGTDGSPEHPLQRSRSVVQAVLQRQETPVMVSVTQVSGVQRKSHVKYQRKNRWKVP